MVHTVMEKVKAAIHPDTAIKELWRWRAFRHIRICLRAHGQGLLRLGEVRIGGAAEAVYRANRAADTVHGSIRKQLQAGLEVA